LRFKNLEYTGTTMNKSLLTFFSFLLLALPLSAQKYSNEFLSIGVGARAQALGNAVVANVSDVTAGVWNPAGLAAFTPDQGLQLGAMHSEWFGGVGKFDYIGLSLPLANKERRIALSLIRFGIDGIPNTLSLYDSDGTVNYDNIVEFSAADYAFIGSYAQPIKIKNGQLLVGGNIKVVHRRIGPFATSWGFGADLGAQLIKGKWRFGAVAKDITTTFNAWSFNFTDEEKEVLALTNNEIPISSVEITKPQLLLGASYKFQLKKVGFAPELDLTLTTDGQRNTLLSADPISIDPAFGLEVDYNQFIFLRLGINQFQRELDFDNSEVWLSRPSIGVGLKVSALKVDYAFTDLGDSQNRFSHVISLLLDIKPKDRS
jgi:hypothetical protein